MRDGAAERRLGGGAFGVEMNPLVIVGRLGEGIDHLLGHRAPLRAADLAADGSRNVVYRYGLHGVSTELREGHGL